MGISLKLGVIFFSILFVLTLATADLFLSDPEPAIVDEQCLNECNNEFYLAIQRCADPTADPNCEQNAQEQFNACVASCEIHEEPQVLCCFGDGANDNCQFTTATQCRENGGAVIDCGLPEDVVIEPRTVHDCNEQREQAFEECKEFKGISRALCMGQAILESQQCKENVRDIVPTELKNFTTVTANASDSALTNLTRDVVSTGVNNSAYNASSYDCRSFAHSLERNLTTLGYNATWTAYWCYGGVGNPPAAAHAVTDVHLADGRTVFIEPQNNRIINLDFDGDGVVETNNNGYTPGQNTGQTDDNCKISVFEDRAAAAVAGVPGA